MQQSSSLSQMADQWRTLEQQRTSQPETSSGTAFRNGAIVGGLTLGALTHGAKHALPTAAWKRAVGGTVAGSVLGGLTGLAVNRYREHAKAKQTDPLTIKQLALETQMRPLYHATNQQHPGLASHMVGSFQPRYSTFYDNPFHNHYAGTEGLTGTTRLATHDQFPAAVDDYKRKTPQQIKREFEEMGISSKNTVMLDAGMLAALPPL